MKLRQIAESQYQWSADAHKGAGKVRRRSAIIDEPVPQKKERKRGEPEDSIHGEVHDSDCDT